MSYSTFLESQNKNILNSLHEWQEKALQYGIVIEEKDKRIAELEDILNHIKRHNDHLAIQNEDLEARNKNLSGAVSMVCEAARKLGFPRPTEDSLTHLHNCKVEAWRILGKPKLTPAHK